MKPCTISKLSTVNTYVINNDDSRIFNPISSGYVRRLKKITKTIKTNREVR